MSNERYEELASNVVDLLGGRDNITNVMHCMTRLRFNVKDTSKVDAGKIGELEGAMGTQWAGNQLQIIVGQSVGDAYRLVCEKYDFAQTDAVDENLDDVKAEPKTMGEKLKALPTTVLEYISGSIVPLLPALIGCGFIQIVALVLKTTGVLDAESSTASVLQFIGDSAFYFLPVMVGGFAAKKLGANAAMGLLLGAMLIHPDFVALAGSGNPIELFGLPVYSATYGSSVFPILLAVAVMAPIERFVTKIAPEALRVVLVPFVTLCIMAPLTLCVIAPLGSIVGTYFAAAMMAFYNASGFVGVALFSALYPWIVMTGMHLSFIPYLVEALTKTGSESFFVTAAIITCLCQGFACIGVALKTKDHKMRSLATSCAITALPSGIIEPAMFGVTLRLRTPMYCAMAGSFVGAAIAGFGGACIVSMPGITGLLALPAFITSAGIGSMVWEIAGIIVGGIVSMVLTMMTLKEDAH